MRTISNRRKIAIAIILAAVAATPAAHAQTDSVSQTVSTQGLDLSSPADQAILRHRLARIAAQVCSRNGDTGVAYNRDFHDCKNDAFGAAWKQAELKIAAASTHTMVASAAPK